MQKILGMLEQNVQWLVLGLGGLYLLWMIWSYVINPPVFVEMSGQQVKPAEVDEIVQQKAATLDAAMKRPAPPIRFAVDNPVDHFTGAINSAPTAATLPSIAFYQPTGKIDVPAVRDVGDPRAPAIAGRSAGMVEKLPELPAPIDILTRRGRSTVLIPDPAGAVDPANQALGPVKTVDQDWVTVRFTAGKDALAKSLVDTKIPDNLIKKSLFLQAELVRQEQLADGQWDKEVVVPLPKGSRALAFPATSDRLATTPYLDWARGNQAEIMQPLFYTVAKGDRWGVPGMEEKEQQNQQAGPFDVNQWIDAPSLDTLTADQKKQVMDARAKRSAEQARQRREQNQGRQRNTPGSEFDPGAGGGRRGGGGPGGAGDAPRNFQERGFQPTPLPVPGSEFAPGSEFGPGVFQPQQQMVANINLATEFPLPNGEFDPRDPLVKDITGWIHDTTVQPGATYRYKVRYKVRNPLYLTNIAKNPADAAMFAITSAESEWSSPISIPALTSFFVASSFSAESAKSVRFDVDLAGLSGPLHQRFLEP